MDANERAVLIRLYRDGYRVVMEALDGVTEDELDRSAGDGWTPRQIAHHLADSEMESATRIRRLLVEQSPVVHGYDEKAYAERLTGDRPIQPSGRSMNSCGTATCRFGFRSPIDFMPIDSAALSATITA